MQQQQGQDQGVLRTTQSCTCARNLILQLLPAIRQCAVVTQNCCHYAQLPACTQLKTHASIKTGSTQRHQRAAVNAQTRTRAGNQHCTPPRCKTSHVYHVQFTAGKIISPLLPWPASLADTCASTASKGFLAPAGIMGQPRRKADRHLWISCQSATKTTAFWYSKTLQSLPTSALAAAPTSHPTSRNSCAHRELWMREAMAVRDSPS
jgi:hypothetical protein